MGCWLSVMFKGEIMNVVTFLLTLDFSVILLLSFVFVVILIYDVDLAFIVIGIVIIMFSDEPVVVTITSTGRRGRQTTESDDEWIDTLFD